MGLGRFQARHFRLELKPQLRAFIRGQPQRHLRRWCGKGKHGLPTELLQTRRPMRDRHREKGPRGLTGTLEWTGLGEYGLLGMSALFNRPRYIAHD